MGVIGSVLIVLAVASVIAIVGARVLTKAHRSGHFVGLLPWWYAGGQPDQPTPPDRSDRHR